MITPIFITSSNINTIGYQPDLPEGTLYIRFNSGDSYSYADVPQTVFDALQSVESAGQYFHRMIRNKFIHTKLDHYPFGEVALAA